MSSRVPSVLVVEDDPGIQRLVAVLLRRMNASPEIAENGAEALHLVRRRTYDLLVLDLMMPVMDGVTFSRELARMRPDLLDRTIVITALSDAQILNSFGTTLPAMRLPVVRKPFDIETFVRVAEQVLASAPPAEEIPDLLNLTEHFSEKSMKIGARAGLMAVADGHRITLDLVCAYGFKPGLAEGFFPLAVNQKLPMCVSFRTGQPVWLASLKTAENEYPLLAPIWEKGKSLALAAVPISRRGQMVGVAGWSFAEPQQFNKPYRRQLLFAARSYGARISRYAAESPGIQTRIKS